MSYIIPVLLHNDLSRTEYRFHQSSWHKRNKLNNKLQNFGFNMPTPHKILYAQSCFTNIKIDIMLLFINLLPIKYNKVVKRKKKYQNVFTNI